MFTLKKTTRKVIKDIPYPAPEHFIRTIPLALSDPLKIEDIDHYAIYSTETELPISPHFTTLEELAHHLCHNPPLRDYMFGDHKNSYSWWLQKLRHLAGEYPSIIELPNDKFLIVKDDLGSVTLTVRERELEGRIVAHFHLDRSAAAELSKILERFLK